MSATKKGKKKKKAKKKAKSKAKTKELLMFVLDPKTRQRIGVVVAQQDGDDIKLGWSKCMTKPTRAQREQGIQPDVFDKTTGQAKARGRASRGKICVGRDGTAVVTQTLGDRSQIPNACVSAMQRLGQMASKYFKKK